MEVKCHFASCPFGGYVERNSVDFIKDPKTGKNYHKECYEQQLKYSQLTSYICLHLGLKTPGPRINAQIKHFVEQGYTYEGILNALKYWFEILKKKDKYSIPEKTIGIVPYVYADAQEYYRALQKKQEALANHMKQKPIKEPVVVKMPPKKVDKPKYNLDDIK